MDDRRYPETTMQQPGNPSPRQNPPAPQGGGGFNSWPYGGAQGGMNHNARGGWNQNVQGSWNQNAQNGWNGNAQGGWNQYMPGGMSGNGIGQQSPSGNGNRHSVTFWALAAAGGTLLLMFFFFACWFFLRLNLNSDRQVSRLREPEVREEERSDFWTQEDEREKKREKDAAQEYERDTESIYGITPDADYYSGLTDSINTTTDYGIEWKDYTFEDPDTYAYIYVVYPQIVGEGIPNLELLNENLEAYAMSVLDFYSDVYLPQAGSDDYLNAGASVYVTYNDDSTISVVVAESIEMPGAIHEYLCCLNLDLVNGKIVWNTDMLEMDDAFLAEFRKQVALQNGWNMEFTDQELYEYMASEDMLILFYTPVGLEVGINYVNDYNEVSWVTATIKDYHKYVKSIG